MRIILILCAFLLASNFLFAGEKAEPSTKPVTPAELDTLDPGDWGIDHGCIQTSRIRDFRYFEAGAARLTLTGGKEVIMRFTNQCRGFRNNGIIYETRIGKLCAGFDSVRVLKQGTICPIASIEPYIEPAINEKNDSLKE